MIRIRRRGKTAKRMKRKADRADLRGAERAVESAITSANAALNFDPDHAATILEVRGGRGRLGSRSASYARLLLLPKSDIAQVWKKHIVEGE